MPKRRSSVAVILAIALEAILVLNAAAFDGAIEPNRKAHSGGLRAQARRLISPIEEYTDRTGYIQGADEEEDLSREAVNVRSESFDASNLILEIPPLRSYTATNAVDRSSLESSSRTDVAPIISRSAASTAPEDSENRIVGGFDATESNYPFFAAMRSCNWGDSSCNSHGGDFDWGGCGATLIAKRFILTAGHCVENVVQNQIELKGFTVGSSEFVAATWSDVTVHPRYDLDNYDMPENDVAIVELSRDVPDYLAPAYVDTGSLNDRLGQLPTYTAVGLGKIYGGGPSSVDQLLEADLLGLDDSYCRQQYGSSYHSDASMLCAGQSSDGQFSTSTCNGDSGGPLLSMDASFNAAATGIDRPILTGVTSWGPNSCAGGLSSPSVFAKVGAMVDWFGPLVCNSFDYEADRPEWCLACNGSDGGCRNNIDGRANDDWCCQVGATVDASMPTSTTTTTTTMTAVTTTTTTTQWNSSTASSSSTAAAPQPSSSTTLSSSSLLAREEECSLERPVEFCAYGNPNIPFCSCGWLADSDGENRAMECLNPVTASLCAMSCQGLCSR